MENLQIDKHLLDFFESLLENDDEKIILKLLLSEKSEEEIVEEIIEYKSEAEKDD